MSVSEQRRATLIQTLAVEALSHEDPARLWPAMERELKSHFECDLAALLKPDSGGLAAESAQAGAPLRARGALACPLLYRGKALWVLELFKGTGFSAEDAAELSQLAPLLAVLLVRCRFEQEQDLMTRQLVQVEKMAAVGRLASGLAHEVNNPLTAILGFTSILLRLPGVPPRGLEILLKIDAEVRRIAGIVGNMLSFARQVPTPNQAVDVAKVLADCASLSSPELKRRSVSLDLQLADGAPQAWGNAAELKQVFLNLLLNACQALQDMGGKGRIAMRLLAAPEGGRLIVEVQDNGPGIPDAIREKIFEPFFTTKGEQGTGLGLYVSAGIIHRQHGTIELAASPGGGALFRVALPVAP